MSRGNSDAASASSLEKGRPCEEEDELLRAVGRASRDAIIVIDSEGRVVYWNPAAENQFGYRSAEVQGRKLHDFLAPERFREDHRKAFPAFQAEGRGAAIGKTLELWACHRSGEEIPVELSLSAVELSRGWHAVGILRDIRARKRAEAHKAQLLSAIDHSDEAVLITDVEGTILYANPAFEKVTGYSSAEALGSNPRFLKSGRHDASFYAKLWGDLLAGKTWEGCFINRRKDGTLYEEEATISPIYDASGSISGFVAVKRDVTERRALEAQLSQAQKLESIGQLAAGIAHEINTPIQFVGDNTRFLQDCYRGLREPLARLMALGEAAKFMPPTESIEELQAVLAKMDLDFIIEEIPAAIEESLEGLNRVARIVRAMKEFSHPGEEKVPCDLNQAIDTTITVARNEWKYVADLERDFDPDPPQVPCVVGDFNQVILNMIVNAAHAITDTLEDGSGEKGRIAIATSHDEEWAEIRISDTGAGIPESLRGRIFEPFFTTKGVGKGTGQGLSIAHSVIVRDHGGTIAVESEMGRGTTFTVRLPLAEKIAEEDVGARSPGAIGQGASQE